MASFRVNRNFAWEIAQAKVNAIAILALEVLIY